MRITLTNAHKNPISLDCPWMYAEDEEAWARLGKKESIMFNVGGDPEGDPRHIVHVGLKEDGEFFVDVMTEDESPERLWSYKEEIEVE